MRMQFGCFLMICLWALNSSKWYYANFHFCTIPSESLCVVRFQTHSFEIRRFRQILDSFVLYWSGCTRFQTFGRPCLISDTCVRIRAVSFDFGLFCPIADTSAPYRVVSFSDRSAWFRMFPFIGDLYPYMPYISSHSPWSERMALTKD